MKKLLLALQYWEGDRAQAMKLARLITDLQPGFCQQADFLFMSRFDCAHDMNSLNYVSSKFNIHHAINHRRQGVGWPHGPNELWFGVMDWIFTQREANLIPEYKAVLTFEADSCPLSPHWISSLSREWDRADVKVLGSLQPAPAPHINGNCLLSLDPKFLHWVAREVGGCTPHAGWDFFLAPHFKRWGWANTPLITSHWQTRTLSPELFEQLSKAGVVLHHGVKDDSCLTKVREQFLSH
jgi:hypothetical protein